MIARITAKGPLVQATLTRQYSYDIIENDEVILGSQVVEARPSEIAGKLQQIVTEYQAAYEEENDLNVNDTVEV